MTTDDTLVSEMIGLLREIRATQDVMRERSTSTERAVMSLSGAIAAFEERRVRGLVAALWGVAGAVVLAAVLGAGIIAAALVWGV